MTGNMRRVAIVIILLFAILLGYAHRAQCKQRPMRVVTVKVVADRNFASQEVWQRLAARQIEDVTEEIRGLLGVDLKITEYAEWRHKGDGNLYDVAAEMTDDIPSGGADIIIGFTYGPCPKPSADLHADGVTIPFRGIVLRNYYAPCDRIEFLPYALIHELVHLFGGVHVGQGSLMSPVFRGNIYLQLDPINRAIVGLTRNIDFTRGFASLDRVSLEKLVELYRKAIADRDGDLTARADLAGVYQALGRYDSALDIYRGILAFDSTGVHTWLNIAQCYFDDGRTDSALDLLAAALKHTSDSGQVYYRMAGFQFKLGACDEAYKYAAKAAWSGVAVDSGFIEEIKRRCAPGDKTPVEKK